MPSKIWRALEKKAEQRSNVSSSILCFDHSVIILVPL